MSMWITGVLFLLFTQPARSEVVRMEILERQPFAEGYEFGKVGAYERIVGRLHCEVDPESASQSRIADVKLAPRNARGRVEFWTDFFLLKPVDPRRGNHRLLYEVSNRGNKLALAVFNEARSNNPTTLDDAGNGFLMRNGWSVLWCGWTGEVEPGEYRLSAGLPVAKEDGKTITGKVSVEVCRDQAVESSPLYWNPWASAIPYPPVSLDTKQARLTMRPKRSAPAAEVPADQWAFARVENGKKIADGGELWVRGGLRPGWLYDLVYTAHDPRVSGLGIAAVRDCTSFFRYETADHNGTANPLAGAIEHTFTWGISQSGRFINQFIYEGFNTDERQRMVFDGALSHVSGAGRGLFNKRFGMATLTATQHESALVPVDSFPFNTVPQTDPATKRTDDLLAGARASGHVPKIFFSQTSTEYWTRGASLLHTDMEGKKDVALDPNARLYVVAGAQHLGGGSTDRGVYQNMCNPLDDRPYVARALLVAMNDWVSRDVQPPESRYPKIADGTLLSLEKFRASFPAIPSVNLPTANYAPMRLDFGPRWVKEGIADIVPPKAGWPFRTLVPAVNNDGNDLAGLHLPDVAVPLATYTGWNLRAAPDGAAGMLASFNGSYIPFPRTREDRLKAKDPRPSVLERYPDQKDYLRKYEEAARKLAGERLLLEEDIPALIKTASQRKLWEK